MRSLLLLLIDALTTLARLLGPGGLRSVVAENLLLKHQLLVFNRSRRRVPAMSPMDRFTMGWLTLFLAPGCLKQAECGGFFASGVRYRYSEHIPVFSSDLPVD